MTVDEGPQVLLITSDDLIRDCVETVLVGVGARVSAVRSAAEAQERGSSDRFDVVVADHRPPTVEGLDLLTAMSLHDPGTSRILLLDASDRSRIGDAVRRCDLFACLVSPWDNDVLALTVRRAAELAGYRRGEMSAAASELSTPRSENDRDLVRSVIRVFV